MASKIDPRMVTKAVVGPASSTDNAAARFDAATGELLQDSALLIADTTAALSRQGGGGIELQRRASNAAAAAGNLGEVIEASVIQGSAVSLTTATPLNLTSISLTAGDWDISGAMYFTPAASTSITDLVGSVSATANTLDQAPGKFFRHQCAAFVPGNSTLGYSLTRTPLKLNSTTTIYLVGRATFTVSTLTAWGLITARRI